MAESNEVLASTTAGVVRGTAVGKVSVFKGIPYGSGHGDDPVRFSAAGGALDRNP